MGSSDENFDESEKRNRFPSTQHQPRPAQLMALSDSSSLQSSQGLACGGSGSNKQGGGNSIESLPMAVRNAGKVGKEVKLQKKPPKKEKQIHLSGSEEKPTLASKKGSPPRRNKSTGRRNSQAARQAGGHADKKIRSLESLFGKYLILSSLLHVRVALKSAVLNLTCHCPNNACVIHKAPSLIPVHVCCITGSFQDQLSSYLGQLGGAEYQKWVIDAIEKEKLKQQHLKVVINHLESEVSNLAQETVNQMENSMVQVRRKLLTCR